MGATNGRQDLVFQRDLYNLMPALQKSAIVLSEEYLKQGSASDTLEKDMEFLTLIAVTCARIYQGGRTHHEENCHLWNDLLKACTDDSQKARVMGIFCASFTQTTMMIPLLVPNFGQTLGDCTSDEGVLHAAFFALLEALSVEDRRKMITALKDIGAIGENINTAVLRKTAPQLELPAESK